MTPASDGSGPVPGPVRGPVHAPVYSELAPTRDMYADARAARRHLRLERAAQVAVEPAPSLAFDDYPREVSKREIRVSDAAQRLANALHLHLD